MTIAVDPILEVQSLSKHFGGTRAIDGVSLSVRPGEVHALVGANGAGKSTLIKLLAGVYRPDSGDIIFQGRVTDPTQQRTAIAFIHQDLAVIDQMSVAENFCIELGYPRRYGLIGWRQTVRVAESALEAIGVEIDPTRPMASLSVAERSMVAIGRALTKVDVKLMVLDEPTASLPSADVDQLFATLETLRRRGLGMLYVSHRLDEISRIADRVTVLRDGLRISTSARGELSTEELVEQMVGSRGAAYRRQAHRRPTGPVVLEMRDLVAVGVGPVSAQLHAGEVIGLVGLRGAGQEILGRALFGASPIVAGSLVVNGREERKLRPWNSVEAGTGFIASDRIGEGLSLALSSRENLFLSGAVTGRRPWGMRSRRGERRSSRRVLEDFEVRPADPEALMSTLSGGNQQKVVLARWLASGRCRVLVMEEPTSGVDVGAKAAIYTKLSTMVDGGLCVVVASSDFEEVCTLCDRALVFSHGRVARELQGEELTIDAVVRWTSSG